MKNIAIVAGGDSSEYEVSLRSAKGLFDFIDKDRYNLYTVVIRSGKWTVELLVEEGDTPADKNKTQNKKFSVTKIVEVDKNDFSIQVDGKKIKFDYVYNTIHGCPGEDGRLQGYFDLLHIPYSSSGVLASALTFNKYFNNLFLKTQGVCVADSIRIQNKFRKETTKTTETRELSTINYTAEDIIHRLGLPVFVKPNDGGSSFGVTKVIEASQLQPAVEKAFTEGQDVIIECFIEGTEVTCGCYKTKTKEVVFPVTEVVPNNEFFDYNAKYNGEVQEITPARITDELTVAIQQETLRIYDLIDARGIIRIDYIIPADKRPVLLDVNTNPGMTESSFIPQQIKAAGLSIKEVLTDIIENR